MRKYNLTLLIALSFISNATQTLGSEDRDFREPSGFGTETDPRPVPAFGGAAGDVDMVSPIGSGIETSAYSAHALTDTTRKVLNTPDLVGIVSEFLNDSILARFACANKTIKDATEEQRVARREMTERVVSFFMPFVSANIPEYGQESFMEKVQSLDSHKKAELLSVSQRIFDTILSSDHNKQLLKVLGFCSAVRLASAIEAYPLYKNSLSPLFRHKFMKALDKSSIRVTPELVSLTQTLASGMEPDLIVSVMSSLAKIAPEHWNRFTTLTQTLASGMKPDLIVSVMYVLAKISPDHWDRFTSLTQRLASGMEKYKIVGVMDELAKISPEHWEFYIHHVSKLTANIDEKCGIASIAMAYRPEVLERYVNVVDAMRVQNKPGDSEEQKRKNLHLQYGIMYGVQKISLDVFTEEFAETLVAFSNAVFSDSLLGEASRLRYEVKSIFLRQLETLPEDLWVRYLPSKPWNFKSLSEFQHILELPLTKAEAALFKAEKEMNKSLAAQAEIDAATTAHELASTELEIAIADFEKDTKFIESLLESSDSELSETEWASYEAANDAAKKKKESANQAFVNSESHLKETIKKHRWITEIGEALKAFEQARLALKALDGAVSAAAASGDDSKIPD